MKRRYIILRKGGMRVCFEIGAKRAFRSRFLNGDDNHKGDLDSFIDISVEDAEHDIQDLKADGYTEEKK